MLDEDNEHYPTETGENRALIQYETINRLEKFGYLTTDQLFVHAGSEGSVGSQFPQLDLTERGLAVLNAVPDVLQGKEPLGKRLKSAVRSGSFEAIKTVIPTAIQLAIGGHA